LRSYSVANICATIWFRKFFFRLKENQLKLSGQKEFKMSH